MLLRQTHCDLAGRSPRAIRVAAIALLISAALGASSGFAALPREAAPPALTATDNGTDFRIARPDPVPDGLGGTLAVWIDAASMAFDRMTATASQAGWELQVALGVDRPDPPIAATPPPSEPDGPPSDEMAPVEQQTATPADPPPAPAVTSAGPQAVPPAEQQPAAAADPAPRAMPEPDPALLTNMVFDHAARLPNGGYFVPKPTQLLFGVRTALAATADVRPSVKLPGRIVPDPHSHGDVEASLLGRIEAPPAGLPVLGDRVVRGQILGFVTPAIGVVDRAQVHRDVARLTAEIRLETEARERLDRFWFVPFRDGKQIQSQMKIDGLRRERDALLPMLQVREVLRASVDGVVSRSTAILGRIVHPGELVFEIVDPRSLWVEAAAQDLRIADMASQAAEATAATPEGETLHLTFVGSGLMLEQQAAPLLLRIDDPTPGLRVERPVTVTIRTNVAARHGIVVPRAALSVGPDGITQVWVQSAPEQFIPYPVREEDIDNATVLVLAGLPDGKHVVVQGLKLLTQLN